jgi:hypothetical protein
MYQVFMKVSGSMYTNLKAGWIGGKTDEPFLQQFFY